jgi:hypothetical protein
MPDTAENRERLARLETQMENLTEELKEARDAIKELTAALNQMQGGIRWSMAFGGFITAAVMALAGAGWAVFTWLSGRTS